MTQQPTTNESINPSLEKLIIKANAKLVHTLIIREGVVMNPDTVNQYLHTLDGLYYCLYSGESERTANNKINNLFSWYRFYTSPKSQNTYTAVERVTKDNELTTTMQNVIL